MSGAADRYSVDAAELDSVVGRLEDFERDLDEMVDDLARDIARLQSQWDGLTAAAQREAHDEWETGMRAMREALAGMRAAGRKAHQNYTRAVEANVSMWEGLA